MNHRKIPAVVLAAALQILPMCRVACVNQAVAPSGFAIVIRWLAGAAAVLGSYHAVSGASASISGVASWTQITNGAQAGPLCPLIATGTVGQSLLYKVILTNPGTQNTEFDYYNYDVLPPGLTMNTNVGGTDGIGNEFITGTPAQAGNYTVTLLAGNLNWPQSVTKAFSITISGGSVTRPGITTPPKSQTVTAGTNVIFSVTATGTPPLSYLWKFNSTAIASATNSSFQLSNVQTTNSGTYSVTVTNPAGSTNASATLTVASPFMLANLQSASGSWSLDVTGPALTNYVLWSSTDLSKWSSLKTNFSATGSVHFTDSNSPAAVKFYRATLSP